MYLMMLSTEVIFWMSDNQVCIAGEKQPTHTLFPIAVSPNSVTKCIFFQRDKMCVKHSLHVFN